MVSGYSGSYFFVSLCGFLSIASGIFMATALRNNKAQLFALFLFSFFILLFDQLYPANTLPIDFILALLVIFAFAVSTNLLGSSLNKISSKRSEFRSISLGVALIFVVAVSGIVAYHDFQVISTDNFGYSVLTIDHSRDQQNTLNYLRINTQKNDTVYVESVLLFQLNCDARDNFFATNSTIDDAKFAVVNPFWVKYNVNPFYGIYIGAPRNLVTSSWILVASYGDYAIYENPNFTHSSKTSDSFEMQIRNLIPANSSIALNFRHVSNESLINLDQTSAISNITAVSEQTFLNSIGKAVSGSTYESSCTINLARCDDTFYLIENDDTALACTVSDSTYNQILT